MMDSFIRVKLNNHADQIIIVMKNEKELFIMLEIPVESLNLFEQLDRNVVAFYRNEEISQTESLNISITQEHYDKK